MGITSISLSRINRYLKENSNILIIGCQNLYNPENYGEIAHLYFESLGHKVRSLDILGCQCSELLDLREDLKFASEFDIVTDQGSSEHVVGGLHQPFKNYHEACKLDGVMIHELPKIGNWPDHGNHYFTEEFYIKLASACGYEVLELCSEAAMGNYTDGWNVSCVLMKVQDESFISEEQFNEIYNEYVFAK